MDDIKNKVVIITGAGLGIGLGMAKQFAQYGARVVVADFNVKAGEGALAEIESRGAEGMFVCMDVSKRQDVENVIAKVVQRWGRVDVMINNAWSSRTQMSRIEWLDDQTMQEAFDIGVRGALWAMQACYPHMKAQGFGRVINLCSLNGVNAHMFSGHYNFAKEALRTLTRTAAVEWGSKGITCNVICPAARTEAMIELEPVIGDMLEASRKAIPMQYFGDPEKDIAPVALFLASEAARYVTGNTLFVDGGSHINGSPWKMELPEDKPTTTG